MTAATRTDWRDQAACRGVDPDVFFPAAESGTAVYAAHVAVAKTVCARCPVRAECLDEALTRIPYGIAGGLTPDERRGLPGRPAPAICPELAPLDDRLRPGARRAEVAAAGRDLLAAGRARREVADRCGVTERTVARWARSIAQPAHAQAGGGEPGGSRTPLLISQTNPQAGTRTEGAPA